MTVFQNAKLVFPDKIRTACLAADNGVIVAISERFDTDGCEVVDCGGLYLSPGFIDLHVHGGGGRSAMSGNVDDILSMCEAHAYHGTTSVVPTTLAAPVEKILKAVKAISEAKRVCTKANILGVHLEGPYLSYEMRGAQSPENIITPADFAPEHFFDCSKDIVMMGAAPEIPGGLALGAEIAKRGITASVAHSNARFSLVEEALCYGYSDITHIFSACSTITRENLLRVGGVVEAGLALDAYTTQFIADLRHLPAELIRLIYKCKGADGAYAITDGLEFAASDMQEGRVYTQENGMDVVFDDGVMKLADYSSLAGSVATTGALLRNLYLSAQLPLYDAVKMLTETPARVANVHRRKGALRVGLDADIVLFDEQVNIKLVCVGGSIIRNEL
ncbi:MAG: amidohydrolase family protein [Oscillospiraceae bacterium]|jgi:N-acetylglucosamine-6-phosphate deacetylase|nr:amidohydrolase family protein [Oscillospiraceae bacterium]